MSNMAWYAEQYTNRYGWNLVPIEPGRKFPLGKDWGNNTLDDADRAKQFYTENPNWNMGIALGTSRMCSLDIDCEESFKTILEEYGLPADELDNYPTIQGKGKRLMFRVPDDVNLPYCKLNWSEKDNPKKKYTVFELRSSCDGKQRQDVAPPSIHPDTGKPYTWLVQPPKTGDWPTPPKWLIAIWSAWDSFKPQFQDACPWVESKPVPAPKQKEQYQYDGLDDNVNVIDEYIKANDLELTLNRYGYTKRGNRFLSPHSGTGLAGVHLIDSTRCWIHHASDPLCSEDTGQPVNAFDLFCYYDHDGDCSKAVKAAADELGIKPKPRPVPPKPEFIEPPSQQNETEQSPLPSFTNGNNEQFACLGFADGYGYVLPSRMEQIQKIPFGSLRKQHLLAIAPIEWWSNEFPKKDGVDWDMAMSTIMRWCESAGIYDPNKQRGRGAWFDKGSAVLHLGDRLMVDGQTTSLTQYKSNYIYERKPAFENIFDAPPATKEDGLKLYNIFKQLNWANPQHADFALGWVVLAPVCGALSWRPHLWITAQRGSGKSWFQDNLVDPLVGRMAARVQGATTEAGIRQSIQQDARPIMFDEAEAESQNAASRIQSVIELARQASSDSGAEIMKGTANGTGMAFRMRGMFLMGSINVALKQAADESRFTVVQLTRPDKSPESINRFQALEKEVFRLLTDEFCASIRARIYRMIPTIRKNAKTLSVAIAANIGSQRMGDQIGALMAGFCSIVSDGELTDDEAKAIADSIDLSEAKESEEVSDENLCLTRILQHQVRVDGRNSTVTRSLGELVDIAMCKHTDNALAAEDAREALPRFGIAQDGNSIRVSNNHPELERALMGTAWSSNWRRILARIEGAKSASSPGRFAGVLSRYVTVPI